MNHTAQLVEQTAIACDLALIHRPGEVFELRALDAGGRPRNTASGYFNDVNVAAEWAMKLDLGNATGVYHTINPLNPALLARAANRVKHWAKATATDNDVLCRRWLMLDIDPPRPSGICATEAERANASETATAMEDILRSRGWPYPLIQDSGNGRYLLYSIELDNTPETAAMLRSVLLGANALLSESGLEHPAKVDLSVYNAARIVRVSGTTNRKGDNIPERPHRISELFEPIEDCPVIPVSVQAMRDVAALAPTTSPSSHRQRPPNSSNGQHGNGQHANRLDLPRYLRGRGVEFRTKLVDGAVAYLVQCPFDASHGDRGESSIVQADSGLTTFHCMHDSCQGRKWNDVREALGAPQSDEYDPPLSNGSACTSSSKPATKPAAVVTYLQVEVGTTVKATDKGEPNYGEVKADNGSSCSVHFVSPDGQHATPDIAKEHLFLQDGTPLASGGKDGPPTIQPVPIARLLHTFPTLRKPMIHGIARLGETIGWNGPTKMHKSFSVVAKALCAITGRPLFDTFAMEPGRVLLVDNELHPETTAYRIRTVAEAMGIHLSEIEGKLDVVNLRGRLKDIYQLGDELFGAIEPDEYQYVDFDALYRGTPKGFNENDNAAFTQLFNQIDSYGLQMNCVFGIVHHSSKGSQAGKSVTDTGSGAGAQSRAVDCHIAMREHAEPDCIVMEAAGRSFAPIEPVVLRWEYPLWTPATDLDPAHLKTDQSRKGSSTQQKMLQDILDTFNHFPAGATKRTVRDRVGQGKVFDAAWLTACNSGDLVECDVIGGNNQTYGGYKRVYPSGSPPHENNNQTQQNMEF